MVVRLVSVYECVWVYVWPAMIVIGGQCWPGACVLMFSFLFSVSSLTEFPNSMKHCNIFVNHGQKNAEICVLKPSKRFWLSLGLENSKPQFMLMVKQRHQSKVLAKLNNGWVLSKSRKKVDKSCGGHQFCVFHNTLAASYTDVIVKMVVNACVD